MAEPLFKTSTVGLAEHAAGVDGSSAAREVGELTAAQLVELLARFAALDAVQIADADPRVMVTSRLGRFSIGTQGGKLFVYETRDASRTYVELTPAEIPGYLDNGLTSGLAAPATDAPGEEAPSGRGARPRPPRTGLALVLVALGVAAVAGSVAFTFRTDPIDAEVEYTTVSDTEAATLRAQAAGTYVADDGPANRHSLVIAADGAVQYVDMNTDDTIADDVTVDSSVTMLAGTGPVFRTSLGPIEFHAPDRLIFARETYVRQR